MAVALFFVGFTVLLSFMYYRAQATDSTISIKLPDLHSGRFSGIYLAESNELYAKEGLKVKLRESTPEDIDAVDSVISNVNDFAIISPLELLEAIGQGKPIIAVATVMQSSPTAIVSLENSAINKPNDLKNQIVGLPSVEGYSNLIYKELLTKQKVPYNSIGHKKTEFTAVTDLIYGKVDATLLSRLDAYVPKNGPAVKLKFVKPEEFGIDSYDDIIITSLRTIEENPQMIEKFVSATIKGWEQAVNYEDEALEATLKYAHDEYANPEFEKHIISEIKPLVKPENGGRIGKMTDSKWQTVYHIYKNSLVTQDFDVTKAYTLDYLP